jgi:subtilisin-like proprotein convertase family protein
VTRTPVVLILAVALLAAAWGPQPTAAATRNIARTFDNPSAIAIPGSGQAGLYPSTIAVRGFRQGRILDVNVTLRAFSHTFPDDVDILLVAPNGARATVMSDVGNGNDVSNITLTLDNQAPFIMPNEGQLVTDRYKPTNAGAGDTFPSPAPPPVAGPSLAVFNNINPNGNWKLYVVDDTSGDIGNIAGGWSLRIVARVTV